VEWRKEEEERETDLRERENCRCFFAERIQPSERETPSSFSFLKL